MREIIFRGKRLDNGEWVEGYFAKKVDPLLSGVTYCFIIGWDGSFCWNQKVDPATVGQYTGLRDKNGKRIFEGDILEYLIDKREPHFYVVFDNSAWCKRDSIGTQSELLDFVPHRWKVIGNIHDNPELLEDMQ